MARGTFRPRWSPLIAAFAAAVLLPAGVPPAAEATPTVTLAFSTLQIEGDPAAPDTASVGCSNGYVHVSETQQFDPTAPNLYTGTSVACSSLSGIEAFGRGGGPTTLNLSAVNVESGFDHDSDIDPFAQVGGGTSDDVLTGTGFRDFLTGSGGGSDVVVGGGAVGSLFGDLVSTATAGYDVTLTPSALSRSDGHTVVLSDILGARVFGTDASETLDARTFPGGFYFVGAGGDDRVRVGAPTEFRGALIVGGDGADTLEASCDCPYINLAPATLSLVPGPVVYDTPSWDFEEVEIAEVVGGPDDNVVEASNWKQELDFTGLGGQDRLEVDRDAAALQTFAGGDDEDVVSVAGGGQLAVSDSQVRVGGAQVAGLTGVERADVTGSIGADALDLSAFTGVPFVDALDGNDSIALPSGRAAGLAADAGDVDAGPGDDAVSLTSDSDFALTDTAFTAPAPLTHAGIETLTLTGGSGANTFDLDHSAALGVTAEGLGGADVLNAGPASTATLRGGAGGDTISAENGIANAIDCGGDAFNDVTADSIDSISGCLPDPPAEPQPEPDPPVTGSTSSTQSGDAPSGDGADALLPALGPAPIVAPASALARLILRSRWGRSFVVRCPAGRMTPCSGAARLRARGGTLGLARFTVPAGTAKRVRVNLGRRGAAILRRSRRMRARLTVSADGIVRSNALTLATPTPG